MLNFPNASYMGSKRKLLSPLKAIFEQLNFETCLDAFSGTSSVAYLLKSMNKSVDTNDYLMFNYYLAKALIENSDTTLSDSETEEIITLNSGRDNFIEKNFSNIYYSEKDCIWLDSAFANIDFFINPHKRAIALSALCYACIKKRARGMFSYTGMRYDDGRKDLKLDLAEHFLNAVKMINRSIILTKKKCTAFNQDIMTFEKTDYDLVYMDPPYFSLKSDNEYSRRYHFPEGLVSYWSHVQINQKTKTKKFDQIPSVFTHKKNIIPAFEALFEKFSNSHLVLSQSSTSYPDVDTIKDIFKNAERTVELTEIAHVYSIGKMNNKVKEYIFWSPR